jgi:hypothetical protein
VILEEGFSEDDEALAADLATFRDARRISTSAPEGWVGSDNTQDEVVNAQLCNMTPKRRESRKKRSRNYL